MTIYVVCLMMFYSVQYFIQVSFRGSIFKPYQNKILQPFVTQLKGSVLYNVTYYFSSFI